ncbi:transporter substrate-binding domain-containing protein [Vibrio sp. ZSDE26]|uniref:Transporter substrate-binding domain-containing protein n=1 Tax=Vibrio amylolyticus TaxID=2847292 RepID=A0A9X1XKJ7_9VIBR|nr:transporter substrate-binding domain-containing protein [Vibrio amylolyticus]MCK6263598.1 transporter substrate-binding domain-containing protein [Vibrio amylolyticus]
MAKWVTILFLVSSLCKAKDVVTLASGEWYPYQSQSLRQGGYVSHIVSEAFRLEGYEVSVLYYPWARGFDKVKLGDIDGSFSYSKTDDREKYVLYSDIILSLPISVFHLKGNEIEWENIDDLGNYELGGVLGYDYGVSDLEKERVLTINRIQNQMGNYQKLLTGRLDVLFEYPHVAEFFIEKLQAKDQIVMHSKQFKVLSYSLIISKKSKRSKELIKAFNQGLRKLRETGMYEEIELNATLGLYEK